MPRKSYSKEKNDFMSFFMLLDLLVNRLDCAIEYAHNRLPPEIIGEQVNNWTGELEPYVEALDDIYNIRKYLAMYRYDFGNSR